MKSLTREEFVDRSLAILRARKIFIDSAVTKNLDIAFELYQGVLSDRERELRLGTPFNGREPRTFMDDYERPLCPTCGKELRFRPLMQNKEGFQTQLLCQTPECPVLNSEHNLGWWMSNLRKKDNESY